MTVRLPLDDSFCRLLANQTLTAAQLTAHLKGLRIAMPHNGEPAWPPSTWPPPDKITVYYVISAPANHQRSLDLGIGTPPPFQPLLARLCRHRLANFSTTQRFLDGSQYLYLEPWRHYLSGTCSVVSSFRKKPPPRHHQLCVLKLPVAGSATPATSARSMLQTHASGNSIVIPTSATHTYTGYDGTTLRQPTPHPRDAASAKPAAERQRLRHPHLLGGAPHQPRAVIIKGTGQQRPHPLEVVYSE